jgi:hypothetical protein
MRYGSIVEQGSEWSKKKAWSTGERCLRGGSSEYCGFHLHPMSPNDVTTCVHVQSPSKDLISASGTLHDLGSSGLGGLVCAFDRD